MAAETTNIPVFVQQQDGAAAAGAGTTAADGAKRPKKVNKKKPQDVSLYELLEVNWDATPEEIKKAYRKRALKLHPDKGGDPAQFNAMKRAYDVLSDENKRATYDAYGLEMLKVMEGQAGPEVFMMLLLKQRRFRAMILLFAIIFVGFLVLFPVLQSVRWDGADWSWAIVFIPVWFVLAIVYSLQLQMILKGPPIPEGEGEATPLQKRPISIPDLIVYTLLFACAVIFCAFLSARLDSTTTWSWFAVMIPWYLFEIVLCIHRYLGARQAVVEMRAQIKAVREYNEKAIEEARNGLEGGDVDAALRIHEAEEAIKSCDEELKHLGVSRLYLITAFFWPCMRFITAFLIAGKADNSYPGSWFLTAIPFIFGTIVYPCLESVRASADPESAGEGPRVCCTTSIQYYLMLLIWLLGMGKMDNPGIYSAFAVWGVYYVLAFFVFIQLTIVLCINPDDILQAQQQQQGQAQAGEQQQAAAGAATQPPVVIPPAPAAAEQPKPAEGPSNVIILT